MSEHTCNFDNSKGIDVFKSLKWLYVKSKSSPKEGKKLASGTRCPLFLNKALATIYCNRWCLIRSIQKLCISIQVCTENIWMIFYDQANFRGMIYSIFHKDDNFFTTMGRPCKGINWSALAIAQLCGNTKN